MQTPFCNEAFANPSLCSRTVVYIFCTVVGIGIGLFSALSNFHSCLRSFPHAAAGAPVHAPWDFPNPCQAPSLYVPFLVY
jgi:hypothetical protein